MRSLLLVVALASSAQASLVEVTYTGVVFYVDDSSGQHRLDSITVGTPWSARFTIETSQSNQNPGGAFGVYYSASPLILDIGNQARLTANVQISIGDGFPNESQDTWSVRNTPFSQNASLVLADNTTYLTRHSLNAWGPRTAFDSVGLVFPDVSTGLWYGTAHLAYTNDGLDIYGSVDTLNGVEWSDPVPEPASVVLSLFGAICLIGRRYR